MAKQSIIMAVLAGGLLTPMAVAQDPPQAAPRNRAVDVEAVRGVAARAEVSRSRHANLPRPT